MGCKDVRGRIKGGEKKEEKEREERKRGDPE